MRCVLNTFTPVDPNEDVFKSLFRFNLHLFLNYAFPSLLCTQMFPRAPLGGIDGKQFLFTKEGISTPEYSCSVGTMRVHLTLSQKTQARSFSLQMRDLQKYFKCLQCIWLVTLRLY